jgi:hypothetical protein
MRANLRYIAQGYTLRVSYGTVNHAYLKFIAYTYREGGTKRYVELE